jgi:hypothetical protein
VSYLQRVLDINPNSVRAQAGLKWASDRVQAAGAPSEVPVRPDWGGTVDLVPLESERTRWRLPTLAAPVVGMILLAALVWSVSSNLQLVHFTSPRPALTEAPPGTTSEPADTSRPIAAVPTVEQAPSSLPPTETTAARVVGTNALTAAAPPAATTATLPVAATKYVLSSQLSTATQTATAAATSTLVATPSPTATLTTPAPVPPALTVWPTPGPTADPHITPEPTPLSDPAAATAKPTEPQLPGRG